MRPPCLAAGENRDCVQLLWTTLWQFTEKLNMDWEDDAMAKSLPWKCEDQSLAP